jgi:S-adenosylmethionine-diacylglycerol 3-amino-3-carboxypropyl transferase
MPSFLETLNYSSCNEDSNSELNALCIDQTDSVLSITGSGARPLDLLIKMPAKIISIDFNPCQNYLLELKMAAIQKLEYEEFLEFLGVCPSQKRIYIYNRLQHSINSEARDFWNRHLSLIKKGIIYQGRWEKYFLKLSQIVGIIRRDLRHQLFNCTCIDDQANLWNKEWNNILWRSFLRLISFRFVWQALLRDPGFYMYVPSEFSIYRYLRDQFSSAMSNILIRKSSFARLLLFGKYDSNGALPIHLQRKHYQTIRDSLPCIKIVTESLTTYLKQSKKRQFQKYSLSDFSSYTNITEYTSIWKGIVKTALAGAIVCERQFLVKREVPQAVRENITRKEELENKLMANDNSIFYNFIIAKII